MNNGFEFENILMDLKLNYFNIFKLIMKFWKMHLKFVFYVLYCVLNLYSHVFIKCFAWTTVIAWKQIAWKIAWKQIPADT